MHERANIRIHSHDRKSKKWYGNRLVADIENWRPWSRWRFKPYKYYFRFLPLGSNCQRQQSFNGVGTAVKTMPQSNKDFRRIVKAIFSRSRFWADGILCHFVDLSLRSYLLSPVLVDLLMFLHKIYHERLHKSFTKLRWVRLVGSIANSFLDLFALDLKIQGGSNKLKIMMQPCEPSIARIKDFLKSFEMINRYDVFYSLKLRIAYNTKCWMHVILFLVSQKIDN